MSISPFGILFFALLTLLIPTAFGQRMDEDSLLNTVGKELTDVEMVSLLPLKQISNKAIPDDFLGRGLTHMRRQTIGNNMFFNGLVNAVALEIDSTKAVQQVCILLNYTDDILHAIKEKLGDYDELLNIGSVFPGEVPDGEMYKWKTNNSHISGLKWKRTFNNEDSIVHTNNNEFSFLISIISVKKMQQLKQQIP